MVRRSSLVMWLIWLSVSLAVLCLVAQSCLILCDPMDCSPPGFSVHGYNLLINLFFDLRPKPGSRTTRIIKGNPHIWTSVPEYGLWESGKVQGNLLHLSCSLLVVGFPGGSDGEESAYSAGVPRLIPGSGSSPGEGNGYPHQYSGLENPVDRGPWWAMSIASQRARHACATNIFTYFSHFDGAVAQGCVEMVSKAPLSIVQEERLRKQAERFEIYWGSIIGMVNYRKCRGGRNFPLSPSYILVGGLIIKLT